VTCSWNLHAGRDAVIAARFFCTDGGVAVTNVDGSFYDFRCERLDGTMRETLVEPPDDWMGRAAAVWAEELAHGARFDERAAAGLLALHEAIDEIYEEAEWRS